MKIIACISVIVFLSVPSLSGTDIPSGNDRARTIVAEVAAASRRARTLDELGRNTLGQSKRVIDIGAPAVYGLSPCLATKDWKVRFWIADILGYLNNPDAQRPLLRLLGDPHENRKVRRQAYKSLRRLKVTVPAALMQGL